MSRFAISLTLALTIVTGGLTLVEPNADACGVKLGLKRVRPKQKAKVNAAGGDRPVVAQRQARTPIAAGPQTIVPRRSIVEAKPRETVPVPPVAPPPEQVAVAVVPQKEQVVVPAPAPAPKRVVRKHAPTPKHPKQAQQVAVAQPAEPAPVVAPSETSVDLGEEMYFLPNSAGLRGTAVLDKAVRWLKANNDAKVVVEGHADPRGTPEMNIKVSAARAEAVKEFLVINGIAATRIEVQSFGDSQMKYAHGDDRNRRVSIHATK